MRLFQLSWLRGPGESIDENFEILALELLKARYPDGGHFRIGAPDGGIDIVGEENVKDHSANTYKKIKVAYQCKAYSNFRADLVHSVSHSLEKAIETRSKNPSLAWERYTLIVPLLLSKEQRTRLERAWASNELETSILDIDSIESLLYAFEDIRGRFFPDFGFIVPKQHTPIQVGFPGVSDTTEFSIFLHRFQTAVNFIVPLDLTVGGFLEILTQELALPTMAKYETWNTQFVQIDWNLVPSGQPDSRLDKTQTFRQLKFPDKKQFELYRSEVVISAIMYWGMPPDEPDEIYDKNGWHTASPDIPFGEFADNLIGSRLGKLIAAPQNDGHNKDTSSGVCA